MYNPFLSQKFPPLCDHGQAHGLAGFLYFCLTSDSDDVVQFTPPIAPTSGGAGDPASTDGISADYGTRRGGERRSIPKGGSASATAAALGDANARRSFFEGGGALVAALVAARARLTIMMAMRDVIHVIASCREMSCDCHVVTPCTCVCLCNCPLNLGCLTLLARWPAPPESWGHNPHWKASSAL